MPVSIDPLYIAHLKSADTPTIRQAAQDGLSQIEFPETRDLNEAAEIVSSTILNHFKHAFSEESLQKAADARFSDGPPPPSQEMSTREINQARKNMRVQTFAAMTQAPEYGEKIVAAFKATGFNIKNPEKLVKEVTKSVTEGVTLGMTPSVGSDLHKKITGGFWPAVDSHKQDHQRGAEASLSRGTFGLKAP